MKKRFLSMLVLLVAVVSGAWAQENEGWLSGITNGDLSGDDVSSFFMKVYPSTETVPVVINANAGKDGTPGIVVKTATDENAKPQVSDSQFFIVLSEEMPAGSTIRVQFDYKASKAAKASTEYHAAPQSYLYWNAIGDVNFTTEWKTFNGEFTIPKEADGMKTIAFDLQHELTATDYYFDNISVLYKKSEWTNIIANSDMEGKDVSCFYIIDKIKGGPFLARINDGIGKDGSRAIKLQSTGNEPNSWDTQFDIRLPYVLPKGTMYRLSFDYKSDKAGVKVSNDEDYSFGFQISNEPDNYIWWTLDGWPAPYIETTEDNVNKWQHYKKVFVVPDECDGVTKADDNDWLRKFRTIYVKLAGNKVATEFIFDNVKVEILSNVVSTLTPEPVTDPKLMRVYPDPNHQHNFSYKADGATITATCTEGCDIFDPMTLTISAPKNLLFNYQKKEATLNADYNKTAFPGEIAIDYYQGTTKLNGAPFHTGNYSAKVTMGGQTASVDFTINGQTPIRFIKKAKFGNGYAYVVHTLTEYLPVESTNDYCIMLDGRTYIVRGNVVLSKGLIYKGAVNLIVCDKAKLTIKGGIWHIGSQLDIYAEEGAEQTATIDVQGDTSIELEGVANQPALSGNIVLNSGNLTATPAAGGKLAADDLELTIANGVNSGALTGGTLQDDGSTKFTSAQVNNLTSLSLSTPPSNSVKLAKDTEDADNWTVSDGTSVAQGTATLPNVTEGATVTATYSGTKKVIGVKAVKVDPLAVPLTVEAITAGTIMVNSPKEGMQYSLNGGAKTAVTTTIDVAAGDKVQFYGNGTSITSYNGTQIKGGTAKVKVYGNIMSLVDEEGFATAALTATSAFTGLFTGNTTLTDASGLLLPATTLTSYCYSEMFKGCTALTAAPALPATKLGDGCYHMMFQNCSALTAAPELPATTLTGGCYNRMFAGCTNLTSAPELKAEKLLGYCYQQMFDGCSKLASVTIMATSGFSTTNFCTYNWLRNAGTQAEGTKAVYTFSTANWPSGAYGIPDSWNRVNMDE